MYSGCHSGGEIPKSIFESRHGEVVIPKSIFKNLLFLQNLGVFLQNSWLGRHHSEIDFQMPSRGGCGPEMDFQKPVFLFKDLVFFLQLFWGDVIIPKRISKIFIFKGESPFWT